MTLITLNKCDRCGAMTDDYIDIICNSFKASEPEGEPKHLSELMLCKDCFEKMIRSEDDRCNEVLFSEDPATVPIEPDEEAKAETVAEVTEEDEKDVPQEDTFDSDDDRIIEFIRTRGPVEALEIGAFIGLKGSKLSQVLTRLRLKGEICRAQGTRLWSVME